MSFPNGQSEAFNELLLGVDHFTGPSGGPTFYWKCEGCGDDSKRKTPSEGSGIFNVTTGIGGAWEGYKRHLKLSHNLEEPHPPCQFQTTVTGFRYRCNKDRHSDTQPHDLEPM